MRLTNFFSTCKFGLILLAIPAFLCASASGPDPRHTGAPGDGNCTACHTGTALNGGGGKVELQLPNGMTYVPGQKQTITVVVTDPTARRYGFQAAARLGSNLAASQAGTFTPGSSQIVICTDGGIRPAAGCSAANPLEFVEHSSPSTTGQFSFEWTPPATDVGTIGLYVAANAANGNGSNSGDHIYTTSVSLSPAASTPVPTVAPEGGVVNGASFTSGIVAGSWVTVFGSNLASGVKDWTGLIDAGGNFPTAIDGVSVTIDGLPASVYFISPTQINVQAPALTRTGPVPVVVTTAGGASTPVNATVAREAPGLFLFTATAPRYPAAVRSDGVFIGKTGLFPGVTTAPAKPGDVVLLFGTGFGPTTPAVAPGKVFSGAAPLTDAANLQVSIGGVSVTPAFAGISSSGLYQFNVTIPNLPDGDQPVEMRLNGQTIQSDVFLTVQR